MTSSSPGNGMSPTGGGLAPAPPSDPEPRHPARAAGPVVAGGPLRLGRSPVPAAPHSGCWHSSSPSQAQRALWMPPCGNTWGQPGAHPGGARCRGVLWHHGGHRHGALPTVRGVLDPLIELYRLVPPLAYLPLMVIWFGIGETSKVLLIYLAIFAPVAWRPWRGAERQRGASAGGPGAGRIPVPGALARDPARRPAGHPDRAAHRARGGLVHPGGGRAYRRHPGGLHGAIRRRVSPPTWCWRASW